MKRLAAVALVVFFMALPACAQHGSSHGGGFSGHGGFSSHGAQGFHGGFSAPASRGFSSRVNGRAFSVPRGFQRPGVGAYRGRAPYTGSWRHRRPYIPRYGAGVVYGYPVWGAPYFLSDPGFDDYDDDSSAYAQQQEPEQQQPEPQEPDQQMGPYAPAPYSGSPYAGGSYPPQPYPGPSYSAPSAQPRPVPAPASEETVTLVFKDGRPPEQIHNYLMTANTLFVGDQRHREIPVDQLDLAATAKANREAGVDFHLPGASSPDASR
ncbi:MAG TPA: hypothetical protein VGG56_12030 [Terracidiphilus sp.]|jgi:hypothetical protein